MQRREHRRHPEQLRSTERLPFSLDRGPGLVGALQVEAHVDLGEQSAGSLQVVLDMTPSREVLAYLLPGALGFVVGEIEDVRAADQAEADRPVQIAAVLGVADERGHAIAIQLAVAAKGPRIERDDRGGALLPGDVGAFGAQLI